jgi:HD-GYP domain-containing protein (c-di-GMP phosphodiesterase class II)
MDFQSDRVRGPAAGRIVAASLPLALASQSLLAGGFVPVRLAMGGLVRWPRASRPADTLRIDCLRRSPLLERRLAAAWRRWRSGGEASAEELLEGCWAIPLGPDAGMLWAAIAFGEAFLQSDEFGACCRGMPGDRRAMEAIFRRLGLVRAEELHRQTTLLQGLWQSLPSRAGSGVRPVGGDSAPPSRAPIEALVAGIDRRDPTNRGHSRRVAVLSRLLAEAAGLSSREIRRAELAGLVHDVGKVALPSRILRKPGPLDAREYALVRRHPQIGCRMLKGWLGLRSVLGAVRHHHERWDGLGYPFGLRGEAIPQLARIVAIADAYDAMISDRPYRPALSAEAAREELRRGRGTHFDPELVDAFLAMSPADLAAYDRQRSVERRRGSSRAA